MCHRVLVSIIEPIVKNSDAIMTVSRVGIYEGVGPVALSMPCKLNNSGAHMDVPLLLDAAEREGLRKSAESILEALNAGRNPES
jgi:L-lactate dehydrogenase